MLGSLWLLQKHDVPVPKSSHQARKIFSVLLITFELKMVLKTYLSILLTCRLFAYAAVYNWDVTWVSRNPDGLNTRPVIGINGQWPPPALTANVGERVTVHLTNKLGNETTSLHFHGLFQEGTNSMDGPTGATQCPIGPDEKFTYDFTVCIHYVNACAH